MGIRFTRTVLGFALLAGVYVREASADVAAAPRPGEPSPWLFFFFSLVAFALLAAIAFVGTRRLEILPRGLQNLVELAMENLYNIPEMVMGPRGREYASFIGTYFLCIVVMNLMGLIPGMKPGTASLSITLGFGTVAIVAVQYYGFRAHGIKYLLHFLGPVPAMAFLILPIELISELVRPISLSMRLYGNISGEEKVLEAFATQVGSWGPLVASAVMAPLELLTSVLQALVFSILVSVYIALATEEDESERNPSVEAMDR
jgi:F-type H+-transporting ATPase subunit a